LRYPRCSAIFLLLFGSHCFAQCTPDGFTLFDRNIGETPEKQETHLHCESTVPDGNGATIKWIITRPDVTKQLIEYRDITFRQGDQVLVSARGCVDVATDQNKHDWRRYVDPQGSGTDRHFHGLIWIPGASLRDNSQLLFTAAGTAPVRISSVSGSKGDSSNVELLTIQAPPGTSPTLRLGYEVDYDRTNKRGLRPATAYSKNATPEAVRAEIRDHMPARASVTLSGQCKGEPAASVSVLIKRAPQTPPPETRTDIPKAGQTSSTETGAAAPKAAQSSSPKTRPAASEGRPTRSLQPFDPVSLRTDENGFMLSPLWYGNLWKPDTSGLEVIDDCKNFEYRHWLFVRYGVKSPCTQQASFDVPPGLITECTFAPGFGQLHGHVNWTPATFAGKLAWKDRSADQDQDLQLKTLSDYDRNERFAGDVDFGKVGGILTRDSQGISDYKDALWLEYASYETIENSRVNDPYVFPTPNGYTDWQDLLKSSQGRTAIVTGLLNLDCVHECHTELHPVLALALRTKDETKSDSNIDDEDTWAIFLRNSGNEGDCSADAHYLSRDSYTFFLPAPRGATRQIPHVNPDTAFTASVEGVTWSISAARPDSDGPGVLIRFSFAPGACGKIHTGTDPVRLGGTLDLNWNTQHDDRTPSPSASTIGASHPLIFTESKQELSCPADPNNVVYDELTQSEKQSVEIHHNNPTCKSPHCLASALGEFVGREFGVFPDILLYNKTSQVQINPGFRYSVVQTSLGSFEVDGSPGLSRSVRSTNGSNLTVRISDFLYGLKLRFPSALNIFGEAKGGLVFRSASPGYSSTPDFFRFSGHDSVFLIGGGIEPGKPTRTFGLDVAIRLSADYMYLPGTGEHIVRLTIGPQFQIPRRHNE
jgi:hypothetical protein